MSGKLEPHTMQRSSLTSDLTRTLSFQREVFVALGTCTALCPRSFLAWDPLLRDCRLRHVLHMSTLNDHQERRMHSN